MQYRGGAVRCKVQGKNVKQVKYLVMNESFIFVDEETKR